MVLHKVFGVERDIDIDAAAFPTAEELAALEAPLGPHEHGWFDSCIGTGAKLHTRTFWKDGAKKQPKAAVIFLHGVTGQAGEAFEIAGRKTNVALLRQVVNDADMALHAFDYYGHGFSEGTRFYVPSFQQSLQDVMTYIKLVDAAYDGKIPIFLLGASYGGNLTIQASRLIQDDASQGPTKFGGALLFAPSIIADLPPAPVTYVLRYLIAPLCPKWTVRDSNIYLTT